MTSAMFAYIKELVEANPGIRVSDLPRRLDYLPMDVREKHGVSTSAIRSFIKKHSEFEIDRSDRVFVRPKAPAKPADGLDELRNVSGNVIRAYTTSGVIKVEKPINTLVYFSVDCVEDGRKSNLQSAGVKIGDTVVLDAIRRLNHKTPFTATHVHPVLVVQPCSQLKPKSDEGLYNELGKIVSVKVWYGFIKFGQGKRGIVYFHSRAVCEMTAEGTDLASIFSVGDKVRFDAVPNCKPSARAMWKATRVQHHFPADDYASDPEQGSGDEVLMSEDEEDIMAPVSSGSSQSNMDYPVGYPDWEEESSARGSYRPTDSKAQVSLTARQTLPGIEAAHSEWQLPVATYPASEGIITDVQQRVATCSVQESGKIRKLQFTRLYTDGTVHMYNLDRVLKKGDKVSLDYMVGVSRGKEQVHCDLVWKGQKPSAVLQLSPEDFAERLSNQALLRGIAPFPRPAEQLLPIPPGVCCSVAQGSKWESPLRTAQPVEPSAATINMAGQLTVTAARPHLPGPAVASAQSVVRSANVVSSNRHEHSHAARESPQRKREKPCVFIDSARGTIVRASKHIAWAQVKDGNAFLEVEFTSGCFYKDRQLVLEDLSQVLAKGDEVMLDYMVGTTSHSEIVHCDLVWQGRKPSQVVGRLGPAEWSTRLKITKPACGVTLPFGCHSSQAEQQQDNIRGDNQALLVELDLTGKLEFTEDHGIGPQGYSSHETSSEWAAQATSRPGTATGAFDAINSTLSPHMVDVLLHIVKKIKDQVRIEFPDIVRQAVASCVGLTKRAVRDGITQTDSPHSPASPTAQDESLRVLSSGMKPTKMVVQDATTQTDNADLPANLFGELTPSLYSPCTSAGWHNPVDEKRALERWANSP